MVPPAGDGWPTITIGVTSNVSWLQRKIPVRGADCSSNCAEKTIRVNPDSVRSSAAASKNDAQGIGRPMLSRTGDGSPKRPTWKRELPRCAYTPRRAIVSRNKVSGSSAALVDETNARSPSELIVPEWKSTHVWGLGPTKKSLLVPACARISEGCLSFRRTSCFEPDVLRT